MTKQLPLSGLGSFITRDTRNNLKPGIAPFSRAFQVLLHMTTRIKMETTLPAKYNIPRVARELPDQLNLSLLALKIECLCLFLKKQALAFNFKQATTGHQSYLSVPSLSFIRSALHQDWPLGDAFGIPSWYGTSIFIACPCDP